MIINAIDDDISPSSIIYDENSILKHMEYRSKRKLYHDIIA